MDIHIALQEYFKSIGLSQVAIAEELGVTKAYVNALLSGRQRFGKKQAETWSEKFGISKSWLLTGEGEMLNSAYSAGSVADSGIPARIPLIPASAFAGGVEGFASEAISLRNCESVVSPVAGAEYAIPITGDSMEPDYADGSIAYIRRINEAAFIPWGHTVVLDTENGAFIKRIYPDDSMEDYVWARSINPAYPPMHIPKKSIFRIFRVLGTSRIFTTM